MSDLMDNILAQLQLESQENNSTLFGVIQEMKPMDVPRFLNDPSIQHLPVESLPKKESYAEQLSEIGEISRAYNKLRERGELNKLTDSFRNTPTEKIESRTAHSLTQTLASYTRYISLLQATA
jgi:hypothetical protein